MSGVLYWLYIMVYSNGITSWCAPDFIKEVREGFLRLMMLWSASLSPGVCVGCVYNVDLGTLCCVFVMVLVGWFRWYVVSCGPKNDVFLCFSCIVRISLHVVASFNTFISMRTKQSHAAYENRMGDLYHQRCKIY